MSTNDEFSFPDDFLLVGKVAKPHGLRGEVKVHSYSDEPGSLLDYEELVLVDAHSRLSPALKVESGRFQGKTIVIKLESIDDRNDAEAIHNMWILINKKDLQELGDDEFYYYQFYNLPVTTEDGKKLGNVHSIFSNGAQDIMVVKNGDREYLIPIIDTIIKEHTEDGVVITPLPGLLDLESGNDE